MTLRDAFRYVQYRRPRMSINTGFLLHLAKYEIEGYNSTSVSYQPEWRFHEYNRLKYGAKVIPHRENRGTVCCGLFT